MNAAQFRSLRLSRDWSQERMARYLGLSARQVANIEHGRSGISGPVNRLLVLTFGQAALAFGDIGDLHDP